MADRAIEQPRLGRGLRRYHRRQPICRQRQSVHHAQPFVSHAVVSQNGVFVDLGTLPGGSNSCTQWINSRGWIVGGSENGAIDPLTGYPEVRAVLWKDGTIRDLGTLGGHESVASAINRSGQVAGLASNDIPDSFAGGFAFGATQVHAFLWDEEPCSISERWADPTASRST